MSIDLGHLLQSQLGNVLSQFLTAKGETAETGARAGALAIPAIVAGLVKNVSSNPSNASGLFDLIKGAAGSQLTGAVPQAAEGNFDSLIDLGKSLLPNLLGGNAAAVSDQIAQESGVSKASAGSLLSLALPLVLSVLRGHAQTNDLNQSQFLGLLSQQQGWLSQALSGNMLSALGIGSLSGLFGGLSNLAGSIGGAGAAATATAASVPAAKKSGIGKWIALAVAALLALFAFKSCNNQPAPATAEPAASAVSDVTASEVVVEETVAASVPAASAPEAVAPAAADTARVVYEDGVAKFFFATGKNDVAEGAEVIVADVVNAGKDGKKLVVSGFADSTGDAAANEALSKQRAEAVKAFFEAQGVDAANIELRKPENTTGAVGNDVEGRRVEVKVEG
ncbi:OmpA family protein [Uruburuella testudinis]|uniref:OmpA family protein n=1 Tax=Uruburuella testudinis TaxID=1282863 RepID=A0ABY4DUU7_9NEIS|nr:OmpA family protein [Uruburuella testudinis]UOO82228.1 OmpA family protein [Uruburuella testudinis]